MAKILYISYDGLTDALGQSQILAYLWRLSDLGHNIFILSYEKRQNYKQLASEINEIIAGKNITWVKEFYTKSPPVFSTLYDVQRGKQIAKKLHEEHRFDIVHCRGYITSIIGLYMRKNFGVRFIFDMRGFWADEKKESGFWDNMIFSPVYNYFKKEEKKFFNQADYVVTLTNKGKEEIVTHFTTLPNKVGVIPTCVDFGIFKPFDPSIKSKIRQQLNISQEANVLVYSGSMGGNYDIEIMLNIFLAYQKKVPESFFLILSKDEIKEQIADFKSKGIKSIAVLNLPFTSVSDYLAAADVGLIIYKPSYSTIGRSPTKLGEYWASGLPVITLKNIGDVDYLEKKYPHGIILLNPDLSNLQEKLEQLLLPSKELLRSYAENHFHINKGVSFYDNVYQRLSLDIENQS